MSVLKKTVLLCVLAAAVVVAQGQGAKVFPPTADQKAEIHKKLAELSARIAALGSNKADPQLLADVQIYKKATEYILRFPDEFFGANYAAETITALDTGIGRSIELENGTSSWTKKTGNVVRGFVSRIDGSFQPYGLTIPASYDGKRPMRLDVWLHGTQQQMNEVRFLQQQAGPHETSQILADDYIMVEPFARMNHSYKFYAETDVYEAIAAVRKHYNIDAERIVIRGHSMGGHQGSGRLAFQNPTFFGAYEASAGYSETKEYAGNRLPKEGLTPYQEAALHYVDAEDYALNAFNVPGVSYGGEKDAQLRASTRFREAIVREGFQLTKESPYKWTTKDLRLLFLVGPDTGHAWHKESKAESEAFHPQSARRDGGQGAESRAVRHLHDEIQQRALRDGRASRGKLQARRRRREAHRRSEAVHGDDEERRARQVRRSGRLVHHRRAEPQGGRECGVREDERQVGGGFGHSRPAFAKSTACRGRSRTRSPKGSSPCAEPASRGTTPPTSTQASDSTASGPSSRSGCAATFASRTTSRCRRPISPTTTSCCSEIPAATL